MFKRRKTNIFWLGLLILGIAIVAFFESLWYPFVIYASYSYSWSSNMWLNFVPVAFGSIVFMFIGLYMMKSCVTREGITV